MAGAVASGLAMAAGEGGARVVEAREGTAVEVGIVRVGEVMGMVRPEQEEALEMLVDGVSIAEISRKTTLSRTTVRAWLDKDAVFLAAFNQWRTEKKRGMELRVAKMSEKAAGAVEKALDAGDGRLGLRLLEKMGMIGGEEIGPTSADEIEEGRKIARRKRELRKKTRGGGDQDGGVGDSDVGE